MIVLNMTLNLFPQAAALTGLIDHMIWIWPDWDEEEHREEEEHMLFNIIIGYTEQNHLCVCWKQQKNKENAMKDDWECRVNLNVTEMDVQEVKDLPSIPFESCVIKEHGTFESIRESKAVDFLRSMDLKDNVGGIILDIDEDYFGCWSDVYDFNDKDVQLEEVEFISDIVSNLFCASNSVEEQLADDVFSALIQTVITLKHKSCSLDKQANAEGTCYKDDDIEDLLSSFIFDILTFITNKNQHLLCTNEERLNVMSIKRLLMFLKDFDIQQLQSLSKIGICFSQSPSVFEFDSGEGLHVCHGFNTPNDSAVSFSFPDNVDIVSQKNALRNIFSSIFRTPDLISVCRSVRDGYTPKEKFTLIESAVLSTVSAVYPSVNLTSIHFDSNLLGGSLGWPDRHHSVNDTLLRYLNIKTS